MSIISIKQLLEAGVHFGHHTRRWNPKMAEYIFTERNGIYIIDLQKTVKKFDEAYMFVRELSQNGGNILFVGTKKQAAEAIKEEAERAGQYYVNVRWPGGMLTNFKTIKRSINRLNTLEKMQADGIFDLLPKVSIGLFLGTSLYFLALSRRDVKENPHSTALWLVFAANLLSTTAVGLKTHVVLSAQPESAATVGSVEP